MAVTVRLSSEAMAAVAAQVATFAPVAGVMLFAAETPELGETFQLWTMDGAGSAHTPLPTGQWHHQIYRQGRPSAFAYSEYQKAPAEGWQVTVVSESSLAADIDAAIEVVDRDFTGDDEARLLVLPSYGLQCIWVVMSTRNVLVPAVVPLAYRTTITPLRAYDADAFMRALERLPPAQGIVFTR